MSKSGPIAMGVLGMVIGGGAAVLPISDDYSEFGFGFGDEVTLECGNAFSDDVRIRDGGLGITFADRIFELDDGRVVNASAACEDSRSARRIVVFGGLIGGAVLLLVGLLWPSPAPPPRGRSAPTPGRQRPSAGAPPNRPGPAAAARPSRPASPSAPIPPAQRTADSPLEVKGDSWWAQAIDDPSPDAGPLRGLAGGSHADAPLPAAPAAPIPDSVIASLPPSPVSGRLAPSADPTPAAAPAPIPDAVRASNPVEGVTIPADQLEQFQLSDGQLLLVDDVSIVGRMPAAPVSYPAAVLITVQDRTVSKSHAAFGRTGGELWVEDLHSRNGLIVVREDGSRQASPPGETTPLAVGDAVRLGDQTILTVTLGFRPVIEATDASTERRPT